MKPGHTPQAVADQTRRPANSGSRSEPAGPSATSYARSAGRSRRRSQPGRRSRPLRHGTRAEEGSLDISRETSAVTGSGSRANGRLCDRRVRPALSFEVYDRSSAGRLALNDRLPGAAGCDRVGVAMHELPGAVFGTKDARDAQRDRSDLVASGDLGLEPFDLEDVAEFGSYAFREVLELDGPAIAVVCCRSSSGMFNLGPTAGQAARRDSRGWRRRAGCTTRRRRLGCPSRSRPGLGGSLRSPGRSHPMQSPTRSSLGQHRHNAIAPGRVAQLVGKRRPGSLMTATRPGRIATSRLNPPAS